MLTIKASGIGGKIYICHGYPVIGVVGGLVGAGIRRGHCAGWRQGWPSVENKRGDDVICGGFGDDSLYGGAGHDILMGAQGNDLLGGGPGNNNLGGGSDASGDAVASANDRWDGGLGNSLC